MPPLSIRAEEPKKGKRGDPEKGIGRVRRGKSRLNYLLGSLEPPKRKEKTLFCKGARVMEGGRNVHRGEKNHAP